ncbi:MAG: sugar phosphate nucleotidyltransferase [Bacteroidota bacterium]
MKPTLLILAAGMGSRYGSMKQTEQFGPSGETITDYSIYDAVKAGFGKVIFVISPKMEEEFVTSYIRKFPPELEVDYVIQDIKNLPEGYSVPADRVKPWGTAHAVMMAAGKIREPFAVINADDFYGRESYRIMADFLTSLPEGTRNEYGLVGYRLDKTVSKYGTVSRGVCMVDEKGYLTEIVERTKIAVDNDTIYFLEENGNRVVLNPDDSVSMNLFGFLPDIFIHLDRLFRRFLDESGSNPKSEFFIPYAVDILIKSGQSRLSVLQTPETWFGVTYKEDRPHVLEMIGKLIGDNVYPSSLWKQGR